MIRGTTPFITLRLPANISVADLTAAILSISQSRREIIVKTLDDCTVTPADNSLSIVLSQSETLSLSSLTGAELQLKVKTAGEAVLATRPIPLSVERILNEEVI